MALLFAVSLVSTAQEEEPEEEDEIEEVVTYGTRYPRAHFIPPAPTWVAGVNEYAKREARKEIKRQESCAENPDQMKCLPPLCSSIELALIATAAGAISSKTGPLGATIAWGTVAGVRIYCVLN